MVKRVALWCACIAGLLSSALLLACGSPSHSQGGASPGGTPTPGTPHGSAGVPESFTEAVASIPNRNYELYWLGTEFISSGVDFRGPHVDEIGSEVTEDALGLLYLADISQGGGDLRLVLMSEERWATSKERYETPAFDGVVVSSLTVGGFPARLLEFTKPGQSSVPGGTTLVVQRDDAVVIATAPSLGSPAPGMPDRNPLVEPANLVAVMEQLRPYPS